MDETQTGMWEEENADAFLGNMSESSDEDATDMSGTDQQEPEPACED